MRIVEGNHLGVLADDLLEHWPVVDPLDLSPQYIVVPSLGMARWLTYRIATAFSVCAQVEFVYPANFVWSLFAMVLPDIARRSPFDAASLTWRVYAALGAIGAGAQFEPLHRYLASASARDRLALSRRVASLYSEILVARPTWGPAWQDGQLLGLAPVEHEGWLAPLWRLVANGIGLSNASHPRQRVFAELSADPLARRRLPRQLTVFAVPNMAALYQGIFAELSHFCDVSVYLTNPSPEFWFDLVGERRAGRARRRQQQDVDFDQEGQRLLASLGRQVQDNLILWGLADTDRQVANTQIEELFVMPHGSSLLARLQRDVLSAVRGAEALDLQSADQSLQVHVCHSLARQLEVLHDQLLDALDERTALDHGPQLGPGVDDAGQSQPCAPGEILVLVPDIDEAAATIDAVFGAALGRRSIPYVISGRARLVTTPLLNTFFSLLALPSSRWSISSMAELLLVPALAARFGLADDERIRLIEWLTACGVHWGADAATRERFGLPADDRHTFAEGLSAMFLGYATMTDPPGLIGGVLPYQDFEGKEAQALGKLTRLIDQMVAQSGRLARARPLTAWMAEFGNMVELFFDRRLDTHGEFSRLDRTMAELVLTAQSANYGEDVALDVVLDALRHALGDQAPGAVPAGAVTFCAFGPLRQIPYRMICMLELNGDGRFPRNPQRAEFDLLLQQRAVGDRDLLDEDRGAFLDALLAARERVLCFYTGRSIRDNAVLPPSSVLDDLLDTLGDLTLGGREALLTEVVIEHPLQPFSARYFASQARLFTYASELAQTAASTKPLLPTFFREALPEPDETAFELSLSMLQQTLADPITRLLEDRLGMRLRDEDELLEDDEPMQLDKRERRRIREQLYSLHLSGVSADSLAKIAKAFPQTPTGVLGDLALAPEIDVVERFARSTAARKPRELASQTFRLQRGPFVLSGTLDGIHHGGRFDAQLVMLRDKELMAAWLCHLIMQLLPSMPELRARESVVVFLDYSVLMPPLDDAADLLDDLLEVYWLSLYQVVPLIPGLSWDFVAEGGEAPALKRARIRLGGGQASRHGFARGAQRVYRTVYGAPLTDVPDGFAAVAERVWRPLQLVCEMTPADDPIVLLDRDEFVPNYALAASVAPELVGDDD